MAEKFIWRKAWLSVWRDAASARLDMCSTLLRQWMTQNATAPSEDGTGWLVDEDGDPVPLEVMARECFATLEQIEAALTRLVKAKVAIEQDGRWGVRGWQKTQESPEAARVRKHRAGRDVTPQPAPTVTPAVTVTDRGAEEQKTEEQNSTPSPSAGEREDSRPETVPPRSEPAASDPAPRRTITAPPATIGQRLEQARLSAATPLSVTHIAQRAGIHVHRMRQLEADVDLPTPDELVRIGRTLARPDIADWTLPVRDEDLVASVVRQHRDLGIELGAVDPAARREPLALTPQDFAVIYATEAFDLAAGLSLAEAWRQVVARGGEQLRRDIARGKADQRVWFTLEALAGPKTRRRLLAAIDLDRRDDTQPAARGSPTRRRGPAPPQNPDRLTDGEIPT